MKFLTPSVQSYCLYGAMMMYGVLSSPTPDSIGVAEILVGLLLCLSLRVIPQGQTNISFLVLGYGLSIPLVLALINGHQMADIVRDMIPFFYLVIPVFLLWVGQHNPERFLNFFAAIGITFSIRTVLAYQPILLNPSLWGQGPPADLLYLANSPEVLFSALYCIGQGGRHLLMAGQRAKGICIALLSLIPVVAMALMTQRAGIGAVVIYIVTALCCLTYIRPKWGCALAVLISVFMMATWPVFEPVLLLLMQKTEIVGLNARTQEWAAVTDVVSNGWTNLLFGEGWGGRLENPAVGGLNVNYTHSLVSSLLLKTGIIGTLVILTGCLWPVIKSWRLMLAEKRSADLMILGAALCPFLISVFLYASYKSLGFGLILLVFFIFPIRKLEKIQ